MTEEKYDVVIATLKEKKEALWKMTRQNMDSGFFNIMDQIRLKHIDELDDAVACWKKYKHEWIDEEANE